MTRKSLSLLMVLAVALVSMSFSAGAEDKGADTRLKIAKARLFMQTKQYNKALDVVQDIRKTDPGNVEAIALEAEANLDLGNRFKARELFDEAVKKSPEDPYVRKMQKELSRNSRISIDREVQLTGSESVEQLVRAKAHVEVAQQDALGAVMENNKARYESVRRADGRIDTFYVKNKQRGEIYYDHYYMDGKQARVSLYAADGTVGAGARYTSAAYDGGTTSVQLYIQRPEWEYREGVVDEGTRDAVIVTRTQELADRTYGELSLGVNRYGIDNNPNAAHAFTADGGVSYLLPQGETLKKFVGEGGDLSLNYWLGAAYAFDKESRLDTTNTRFEPFPLDSYEFHTATLYLTRPITTGLTAELYGGYIYDRLGDKGPHYGGALAYAHDDFGVEARLFASRSISSEESSDAYERVGVNLTWKF
ncbi:MAG: tetratricopeptide repeat protein [Hyphomicrobiales bacterium]|nr:tetratricopeptide repeat protein [Rickettsiales bacterium]MCP5361525.1 tetratricopeptide repeat protein [Hyphomicrobiales bacterium]